MLPPLLSVVAHGNHDVKRVRIYCTRAYPRERAHIRVNVRALANVRMHVVLHILYASSVFSDNALFGFFLCLVFRMLAMRTQQIKQNLAQYGLFKT